MTGWNEAFPYKVEDWDQGPETNWIEISNWCTDQLGDENWSYFNGEYRFKTEQYKNWFLLRWS